MRFDDPSRSGNKEVPALEKYDTGAIKKTCCHIASESVVGACLIFGRIMNPLQFFPYRDTKDSDFRNFRVRMTRNARKETEDHDDVQESEDLLDNCSHTHTT